MSRNAFPQIERDYAESLALREHAAMERREAMLEVECGNCGKMGTALSICKHCGEFISITLKLSEPKSEQPPLAKEIDRLRRALARIAALDADRGMAALMQAKDIAAEALK